MNYYKRHLGDYAKNTRTLTTYEHGVYNLVLDLYYTDESPVSTEDAYAVCRADSAKEKASVDRVLSKFFRLDGDVWQHDRVNEEIEKYQEKAEKNRAIGSLGGKQKAKRNASETLEKRLANDTPSHKPLAISQEKEEKQASPSGSRLPADWQLPDDWRAWAASERQDLNIAVVAADFADFWHAKPGKDGRKTDWQATWRRWVRNQRVERGLSRNDEPAPLPRLIA